MNVTLNDFIKEKENGEHENIIPIIQGIIFASLDIQKAVSKAGLIDILGAAGSENIQGESQQKLDVYADEKFIEAMINSDVVAGIASEENDTFLSFEQKENSKYVVLFDPLDGSSNIDVNVSIGTIFSIFKRESSDGPVVLDDFLQSGNKQVAAGYVLYGTSTMFVYSSGKGVNGFTLNPETNEYLLSHKDMKSPSTGKIYSINEGQINTFPQRVQKYIQYCKASDSSSNRPYGARYIGSMVADFHRNLLKGGIFMYPENAKAPKGKLRLMYECNPLSFIAEQSGGLGSNGTKSILEIQPTELHERTPIYLGSKNMVEELLSY